MRVQRERPRNALDTLCQLADQCKQRVDQLQQLLDHDSNGDAEKHAKYFRDKIVTAMATLREAGDSLECIVPDDAWPLPTCREMLFSK